MDAKEPGKKSQLIFTGEIHLEEVEGFPKFY